MFKKFGIFLTIITITIVAGFIPAPLSAGLVPACSTTGACGFCDIVNVFVTLGKWLITGGAGLGLVLIIWAGVGLATAGGNAEKISAAKKQILGVIIGLGMVLVAFQFVTILIAFTVTPSQYGSFAGSQDPEAKKIGSLTNFLGMPWWSICSEANLRAAGSANERKSDYTGTAACRYWGDGTACQKLTAEQEKQLAEQLDKGEIPTNIKRCCQGKCITGECITEQIVEPVTGAGAGSGGAGAPTTPSDGDELRDVLAGATEQAIRNTFEKYNIGTRDRVCQAGDTGNCVNLQGMRGDIIATVVDLKKKCNCDVYVTAGTDYMLDSVHASGTFSHEKGYKVDLGLNSGLDSYITNVYRSAGTRKDDGAALYKDSSGCLVFAREGNHWDVLVTCDPST